MATKKELVEAYQFSRRRLVTAFLSGAPGGREVEPTKPMRSLIGGVALAVLLCAGAGVAGFLGGRPNSDWKSEGSFIISKDTGEQYVVLHGGEDPRIQRVPNFISGQLLLGTAEPDVYSVKDEHIRTVTLGSDLGIEGAPAGLPGTGELIESGWTACTGPGLGIRVTVSEEPDVVPAPGSAFVVRTGRKSLWLLAASPQGPAYRFALPRDATAQSTLLDSLGFGASTLAPEVTEGWLNLFPLGPELTRDAFGVTRNGQPVDYTDLETDLSAFRIGDLVQNDDGYYLLGDEAPQRLEEFPALVHEALVASARPLQGDVRAGMVEPEHPQEWPQLRPDAVPPGEMCAVLGVEDDRGHTLLGVQPGEDASADELAAGTHDVDVEPAGGAYVLSGGDAATGGGSPFVVDAKGFRYALVSPLVADYIGYGDVDPPTLPAAWLDYFEPGVPLSVNAARRLPESAPADASAPR